MDKELLRRQKISQALKGRKPKNLSYLHSLKRSAEWKRNISISRKGIKHSEETKRLISKKKKGVKPSEETKRKISENNARYWQGKKRPNLFSEEWKKEQSERLKGHKVSNRTKERMSELNKGKFGLEHPAGEDKSFYWKGEDVGYYALHSWVRKRKGKSDTCEHCGKSGLKGKQIHWANTDHKYKRNLTDWLRLCAKCHKTYDQSRSLL